MGASWITQIDNKIFNIHPFRPEHPLEDEKQWQRELKIILEKDGYQVEIAGTYEEAVAALNKGKADVAVVDLCLDERNPDNREGREAFINVKDKPSIVCVSGKLKKPIEGFKLKDFAAWFFDKRDFEDNPKKTKDLFLKAIRDSLVISKRKAMVRAEIVKRAMLQKYREGD